MQRCGDGVMVMSVQLVITEKPSVATDVARALRDQDRFERADWGYRGQRFWVAPAAGHLLSELTPDDYNPRYKTWSFHDLPIIPDPVRYKPRDSRAGERLASLIRLMHDPSVTSIINACDAGREGEAIAKLVLAAAGLQPAKPIWRAWFSSMTDDAIRQAFTSLRPDREMWPLEAAALARSEADWLVGINATRAATCTLGGGHMMLSLGRVQTPTLALVVERDVAIEQFTPTQYFTVESTFTNDAGRYVGVWRASRDSDATDRFDQRDTADAVATTTRAVGVGVVDAVDMNIERVAPPKLFDLTGLQREANRRFGLSAAVTLAAAQACYETHKVLSYPRTDSTHITTDMAANISGLVAVLRAVEPFTTAATHLHGTGVDPSPFVNNAKVTDHHGLLPTGNTTSLAALSKVERQIFDLVVWRLLAALSPEQVLERTVVWTRVDTGDTSFWFRSSGVHIMQAGWKAVWPTTDPAGTDADGDGETVGNAEQDGEGELPVLAQGSSVDVDHVDVVSHWTKAPKRFNEASLLGVMATCGRFVDDDEMAEAMKERGLGTPATRAAIIEKLIAVDYLERRKRQLVATDKGRGVILALGDHPLVKPDLTGDWEFRLRTIERCAPDDARALRTRFSQEVKTFTATITTSFAALTPADIRRGQRVLAACAMPGCDGSVIAGRKGWGCSSYVDREHPGCGFVWWFEQGGVKRTEKQLLTFIDAVRCGTATVRSAGPRVVLGACPTAQCSGELIERDKGWGCSSWRSPTEPGCGFVIWKRNADGTEVDAVEAERMRAAGVSNARPRAAVLRPCPMHRCKGSIVERERSFSCNSWKSPQSRGCGLTVWKTDKSGTVLVTVDTLEERLADAVDQAARKRAERQRPNR